MAKQRRRDFDTDSLRHVVADDWQPGFGDSGVEIDDALVIGWAFKKRRQHHDSVRTAFSCMTRTFYYFVCEQGRGLHDHSGTAPDDFGAESYELLGLLLAQVYVHARAGAQDKSMHASRNVAFKQTFKTRVINLALRIKWSSDCQIDAGKSECGH
ncbi:hypothetical protein D3C75_887450 [compost metagenome]